MAMIAIVITICMTVNPCCCLARLLFICASTSDKESSGRLGQLVRSAIGNNCSVEEWAENRAVSGLDEAVRFESCYFK